MVNFVGKQNITYKLFTWSFVYKTSESETPQKGQTILI